MSYNQKNLDHDVSMNNNMSSSTNSNPNPGVLSLAPHHYIHVLDTNLNTTRCVIGPQRFMRQEAEKIVLGPLPMINIPKMSYIVISNPHLRNNIITSTTSGGDSKDDLSNDSSNTNTNTNTNTDMKMKPLIDEYGQIRLQHGETEIRFSEQWPDPFPLYPGEKNYSEIQKLLFVEKNVALKLSANRTFEEEIFINDDHHHENSGNSSSAGKRIMITRYAGDEWLFEGPQTYLPRIEVDITAKMNAHVIKFGQALKIKAKRQTIDKFDVPRKAGEMWLIRSNGAYLPSVEEEVMEIINAYILTDKTALHLCATKTFTDIYGVQRKAGEEWLVTSDMSDSHIPDIYETVVKEVERITLSSRQFCMVMDPYIDGVQNHGQRELRRGEKNFFLLPGESLIGGIQYNYVLGDDEALLLQAVEDYEEKVGTTVVHHSPGDKWMIYGPCEYVPATQLEVIETRKAIPLDENEGIYVRENKTGLVRAVIGETYMLKPTESLWDKELSDEMASLLQEQSFGEVFIVPERRHELSRNNNNTALQSVNKSSSLTSSSKAKSRDKSSCITFRVPHNSAIQVYDYKKKSARVVFGPELVILDPDEQISIQRLSGDKPKRPNVITSLCLMLGPDFMTDIITVETSDHARLELTLAYNWHFDVNKEGHDSDKIFSVRDFVGDACKFIASRIRGAVASENFDHFHKHSAKIIRSAVFGLTQEGKVKDKLLSPANGLTVTNVDIQHIEPVDESTRISLQKSVQMAIEITTKSQEAKAHHDAEREEEEAKGALIQQKLEHEAMSEDARRKLKVLQNETRAIELSGVQKAEAQARAEANEIESTAAVVQARMKAEADLLIANSKLEMVIKEQEAMVAHQEQMNRLEIVKAEKLAEIENQKFERMMNSVGQDTLVQMAKAGPETQAKLLTGLGLKSMMITDGKSPINLFQAANGMISNPNIEESN